MIPQTKEKEVIEMLEKNKYSLRKISMKTGVSWGTVKAMKNGEQKVRTRHNLPMVMRRKAESKICPKCGAHIAVWPCIACNPKHFQDHILLQPDIYRDMSSTQQAKEQLSALLCLANDLQELAALNQIDHILFVSLVTRARTIFDHILKNRRTNGEA